MRRRIAAIALAGALLLATPSTAFAKPSPPTNGANGARQSGQCTDNPNDRPAVCTGT
jgi:hypothetical protein